MNKIFTLAITELKLFFYTPIAYIIGFAFYCQNGILFWYLINKANMPGENTEGSIMTGMTGGVVFWISVFLAVPVITMRLFAYESETQRIRHLFSLPVSDWQITLGKFSGALSFFLLLWLPTLVYALILKHYSGVDLGPILSSYLGIFCLGSFAISLGLFASAFSPNQIISAISSFFLLVVFLLLSMFENMLENSWLKDFFGFINYVDRYTPFSEGIVDTKDVLFFVSGTLLFLIAANETIHYRREYHD